VHACLNYIGARSQLVFVLAFDKLPAERLREEALSWRACGVLVGCSAQFGAWTGHGVVDVSAMVYMMVLHSTDFETQRAYSQISWARQFDTRLASIVSRPCPTHRVISHISNALQHQRPARIAAEEKRQEEAAAGGGGHGHH